MNKALLIGNVGKDPEVRYYEQDQAVAQVVLATTERGFTLQNGTQVPDRTEWHNVVFYRGMAKVVEKYVRKGDKLYVEMLSPKGHNGNVSTAGPAVSEPAPTVQQEEQVNGDMPF